MKSSNNLTFLVVQCLRLHLPVWRVWVRFLVRKLRSHMSHSKKKKKTTHIKQKQDYDKSSKDFLNGHQIRNLINKQKNTTQQSHSITQTTECPLLTSLRFTPSLFWTQVAEETGSLPGSLPRAPVLNAI